MLLLLLPSTRPTDAGTIYATRLPRVTRAADSGEAREAEPPAASAAPAAAAALLAEAGPGTLPDAGGDNGTETAGPAADAAPATARTEGCWGAPTAAVAVRLRTEAPDRPATGGAPAPSPSPGPSAALLEPPTAEAARGAGGAGAADGCALAGAVLPAAADG